MIVSNILSNCASSSVIKMVWNEKNLWSKPFSNHNTSTLPVLMLKNVMIGKYSPIIIVLASQKAKGLMWDYVLIKTFI